MPTPSSTRGWRPFFYTNERQEPPHVHAQKGDVVGYGLHWPLIDEDLAIEPLIAGAEEILAETA